MCVQLLFNCLFAIYVFSAVSLNLLASVLYVYCLAPCARCLFQKIYLCEQRRRESIFMLVTSYSYGMNFEHFCRKLYVQVAELYERLAFLSSLLVHEALLRSFVNFFGRRGHLRQWAWTRLQVSKTLAHSCEWLQWVWSSFNSSMKGQPEGTGWELQGYLGGVREFKTNLTLLSYKESPGWVLP